MSLTYITPQRFLTETVTIEVVGAGGTGTHFVDALASLESTLRRIGHPGFEVTVWDPKFVSPANIGRQRFTAADVGNNKATTLVHRINLFYGLHWQAKPQKHHANTNCDLLVTATDSAQFRVEVAKANAKNTYRKDALWLDMGNGSSSGQLVLGHLSKSPQEQGVRLPNVFDLYPELEDMKAADREAPSCSVEEAIRRQEWPINRFMALACADLLWEVFRKGELTRHGSNVDLATSTMRPMPIDPEVWEFYGYVERGSKRKRVKTA